MKDREKVINDFEKAMAGLFNQNVAELVTTALRFEFPDIEIIDAVQNENGLITFKIVGDKYSEEEVQNFLVELHNKTALKN